MNKETVLSVLLTKLLANILFKTLDSSKLAKFCKLLYNFSEIRSAISSTKNLGTVSKEDGKSSI